MGSEYIGGDTVRCLGKLLAGFFRGEHVQQIFNFISRVQRLLLFMERLIALYCLDQFFPTFAQGSRPLRLFAPARSNYCHPNHYRNFFHFADAVMHIVAKAPLYVPFRTGRVIPAIDPDRAFPVHLGA